jgi:2-keto-4-pentenoate hydratase/2-oxohepta-3-ene-1,7-dioic acid hydratase in catechol pathway
MLPTPILIALSVIVGVIALVVIIIFLNFAQLWFQALLSNARVGLFEMVAMRFRKVDVRSIVFSRIQAVKAGMDIPKEPIVFFKATSAMVGPNDPVVIPRGSEKTDWEVELAFVVGKKASYVTKEAALDHVAGYVLHNDYSERAYQLERGGQWVKGKSCDTFAPIGPFLATSDEIADPENLKMWLTVNGETKQNGNSSKLIFGIAHLVSYLSEFMTLEPGDIVSTGTPPGVGMGFKPSQFIKPGDVVELGIEGLGSSKQVAVAWEG